MSIIYEALRKTQRNREVRNMPAQERMATRNLDWLDKGLVAFILVLVAVIMYLYLPHVFKHKAVQQAAAPMAVATPVVAVSAPAPSNASHLILNGVLLSANEKIALINKQTFHVGDNIEGMKIVKIEIDYVQLSDDGKLFTLRSSS